MSCSGTVAQQTALVSSVEGLGLKVAGFRTIELEAIHGGVNQKTCRNGCESILFDVDSAEALRRGKVWENGDFSRQGIQGTRFGEEPEVTASIVVGNGQAPETVWVRSKIEGIIRPPPIGQNCLIRRRTKRMAAMPSCGGGGRITTTKTRPKCRRFPRNFT